VPELRLPSTLHARQLDPTRGVVAASDRLLESAPGLREVDAQSRHRVARFLGGGQSS
jgi:hypothetical protein